MGVLLLWILAAALVTYSLMLVFLSNFNMGNLMVWVLTAAITACAIWHKPLAGWFRTGAGRVVGIVPSSCRYASTSAFNIFRRYFTDHTIW